MMGNEVASHLLLTIVSNSPMIILAQRTLTSSTIVSVGCVPRSRLVTLCLNSYGQAVRASMPQTSSLSVSPESSNPSLSQSLPPPCSFSLSLSISVSFSLCLSGSLFLTLSLSLSHCLTLGMSLSVSPDSACLCLSQSFSLFLPLSTCLHLTRQLCI